MKNLNIDKQRRYMIYLIDCAELQTFLNEDNIISAQVFDGFVSVKIVNGSEYSFPTNNAINQENLPKLVKHSISIGNNYRLEYKP